jgi:hypothetical protein
MRGLVANHAELLLEVTTIQSSNYLFNRVKVQVSCKRPTHMKINIQLEFQLEFGPISNWNEFSVQRSMDCDKKI